jgi:hypothetical protein
MTRSTWFMFGSVLVEIATSDVCFSKTDLNWKGWLAFFIMMFTHLSKDLINGVKMILLCIKEREDRFANL